MRVYRLAGTWGSHVSSPETEPGAGVPGYRDPYRDLLVECAAMAFAPRFEDMGIDHGGLYCFRPEQFLHGLRISCIRPFRWALTRAEVSPHCSSFIDSPDLLPLPSLLWLTVKIVPWLRRQTSERLVIQLQDGLEWPFPAWMLDPLACGRVSDAPAPRLKCRGPLALCFPRSPASFFMWGPPYASCTITRSTPSGDDTQSVAGIAAWSKGW